MKKTFFESSYRDFGEIKESDDILFQGLKKIPFGELLFFKKSIAFEVIKHAFNIKTKVMTDSIPENARPRAILISTNLKIKMAIKI